MKIRLNLCDGIVNEMSLSEFSKSKRRVRESRLTLPVGKSFYLPYLKAIDKIFHLRLTERKRAGLRKFNLTFPLYRIDKRKIF